MKKITFIATLVIFCCWWSACEYVYKIDKSTIPNKVVVNSYLNPDTTINISLKWSAPLDSIVNFKPVKEFSTKIYEDGKLIIDQTNTNGLLKSDIHPKVGSHYSLEITVPDYGVVTAQTSIPKPASTSIEFVEIKKSAGMYSYYHYKMNEVSVQEPSRSVFLKSRFAYESGTEYKSKFINATNIFCDQFNALINTIDVSLSDIHTFHFFVRMPYKNIKLIKPLLFSIGVYNLMGEWTVVDYDKWGFPIYDYVEVPLKQITHELITASEEFDKYYCSAYEQASYNNQDPALFVEIIPITSNIENGLGVFAGYSSQTIIFEY